MGAKRICTNLTFIEFGYRDDRPFPYGEPEGYAYCKDDSGNHFIFYGYAIPGFESFQLFPYDFSEGMPDVENKNWCENYTHTHRSFPVELSRDSYIRICVFLGIEPASEVCPRNCHQEQLNTPDSIVQLPLHGDEMPQKEPKKVSLELNEWKDVIHPNYSWHFLSRGIHAMNSLYVTYMVKQTPNGEWQIEESGGTTHMDGYGITKTIPKSCIHGSMLDLKEVGYSGYGGGFGRFEYILDLKRRVLVHRLRIADPDCSPEVARLYPEISHLSDPDAYL